MLRFFSFIFFRGFIFVFPLIVVILILNCMMAILNKMSSQFSIFSVMFSISLLLGILFYCYFSPIVIMYFINLFSEYFLLIVNSLDSYKNIFLLKY
ncbi:flagellar biosynthetic protein FliR [Buchnera aphidicola (Hormaphis cornu)]|nr:flagellar biosynthetic protein FliR [Buchnera aphidicola (Hormaphis cornu)]